MSMAHEYEILVKNLLMNFCEEVLDQLEEFEQKNEIARSQFEGCGWSSSTRIFKDASVYGYSCSYSQQADLYTGFQD